MLGALITLLVVKGCVGMGRLLAGRWLKDLDMAAQFGVGGLIGLGGLGTLTFFLGLLPGGFQWGIVVAAIWGVVGLASLSVHWRKFKLAPPKGPGLVALLALVVLGLFSLVSILTPSTMDDWDSLAYHLAVPKLWLAAGKMVYIPSLHQSNFPDVIDDLYVWGLSWGGEAGAKAFSLGFFLLGIVAVFGIARQRYGAAAGWWASLAFATMPAILWESGTAYIDHGYGLFAGLGIVFAAFAVSSGEKLDRSSVILSAIMLGLAGASKYTGLMTVFVVCLVLFLFCAGRKQAGEGFKSAVLVGLVALAIGSPWYIKNVFNTGNPVYPFLSSRFSTRDWDQARAEIYQIEQKSFGVGRGAKGEEPLDPTAIGGATLGLAYQPGRFVNPNQLVGGGTPTGAVGIALVAGLVLWAISGRRKRFETIVLASSGLTLLLWFFLTQQSRYITTLAPPAAILVGGAFAFLPLGMVAAILASLQTLYSLWLFQTSRFSTQIQVVTGKISADDYLAATTPFYLGSKTINQDCKDGKVALYDEVFGYFLDVPYMWANPGHGTLIPYEKMQSADDLVRELKNLGFKYAYINTSPVVRDQKYLAHWLASMGMNQATAPLTDDERKGKLANIQEKWQILFADGVAQGKIQLVQQFPSPGGRRLNGMLFKLG